MNNYLNSILKVNFLVALLSIFSYDVFGQLNLDAGLNIELCEGQTANINSTVSNVPNGGTVNYSWIGSPGNLTSTNADPSFSNLSVGTYVFTGTATSGVSSVSDQIQVTVNPIPTPPSFSIPTTGCPGVSIPISGFTPISGLNYTWHISPSQGAIINGENTASPSITMNNNGNYNVYVTATNSFGCSANSATETISITNLQVLDPYVEVAGLSLTPSAVSYTHLTLPTILRV